ncbi:hypothetical protein D1646_03880 [Pseudoflavonifractor sp. 60]|uniref:hypothetical protein n=1 Tax=Pseudoflavonifractor sp. 60 TaxID=2304576 RepID=UPI0013687A84|nr:hypothetical protein [Pseudoflavonifractor sp. 60]NBI65962.1 hypothetical protein [Pseudoflavonifractor sp. 60]
MELSFYTINDLRLGFNPNGGPSWRMTQFLDRADALEHYCSLPETGVKSLGVTNGEQVLELARCLPLFPDDPAGEDMLVLDLLDLPLWNKDKRVVSLARELTDMLDIRRCLAADCVVPAPSGQDLVPPPEDELLWPDASNAVRRIYAAGTGWLSPKELKRRFPDPVKTFRYPYILKYQADVMTPDGVCAPMELSYWDYRTLKHRTQARLAYKKT